MIIKPIARLVWLQGVRAPDDVEDYYEVARPGDKCVDGSDPFPVYGAEDVQRLIDIETAARRLAYIVRKSVNSGPLSKDPTQEGQAWRALRLALGEEYDERGIMEQTHHI